MIDGFVLAGGHGSRMGADKARVAVAAQWGAVPLAAVVAKALRHAGCRHVAIVRRSDDGSPWIDDEGVSYACLVEPAHADAHPLWGVAAALSACETARAALAPCDLWRCSPRALATLAAAEGAVVGRLGGRIHPLLAVLPTSRADRALQLAREGAAAYALVADARAVDLEPHEVVDANHPQDLGPDPLAALCARLATAGHSSASLALGERARQASRGARPRRAAPYSPADRADG